MHRPSRSLLSVLAGFSVVFPFQALADVAIPTTTDVNIHNGKTNGGSISMTCYGFDYGSGTPRPIPASYTPAQVYQYSTSCKSSSCPTASAIGPRHAKIDYCDLSLTSGNKTVTKKVAGNSVPWPSCNNAGLSQKCQWNLNLATVQGLPAYKAPAPVPSSSSAPSKASQMRAKRKQKQRTKKTGEAPGFWQYLGSLIGGHH